MDDLPQREAGLQAGHHLVLHQVLHLERHARQRDDDVPLALEPHARGRAVGVEQHRAARGDHRLRTVEFVELDAAFGEHFLNVPGHPFVVAHVAAEHLREGLFGDVVLRGAESSGDDGHLRAGEGALRGFDDLRAVVADRDFLADHDARRIEVLGDGDRIGVDDLPDEYFVADGDDGCLHVWGYFCPDPGRRSSSDSPSDAFPAVPTASGADASGFSPFCTDSPAARMAAGFSAAAISSRHTSLTIPGPL